MLIIFIRTILIYIILLGSMRLMGKRQIGELEVADLVTTLLLSEIAAVPVANPEIPLSHAIIPIITLLSMEVTVSLIMTHCPRWKSIGSARPNVLIRRGVLDQKEMDKLRISVEELISELRQLDITDLREVDYAILEQNGKISVIPKAENRQPTVKDLGLTATDSGIMHIIISRGVVNRYNLKQMGLDNLWLQKKLKEHHCHAKEVFLMTVNDGGEVYILRNVKSIKSQSEER